MYYFRWLCHLPWVGRISSLQVFFLRHIRRTFMGLGSIRKQSTIAGKRAATRCRRRSSCWGKLAIILIWCNDNRLATLKGADLLRFVGMLAWWRLIRWLVGFFWRIIIVSRSIRIPGASSPPKKVPSNDYRECKEWEDGTKTSLHFGIMTGIL